MDRGDWQAIVHGFAELDMTERLSLRTEDGPAPGRDVKTRWALVQASGANLHAMEPLMS